MSTTRTYLVKYGGKDSDIELYQFDVAHGETEAGFEALLRGALAVRHHEYGNTEFQVWMLGDGTTYEVTTSVNVRERKS